MVTASIFPFKQKLEPSPTILTHGISASVSATAKNGPGQLLCHVNSNLERSPTHGELALQLQGMVEVGYFLL
jgi:hypothetical protein